MSVKQRNTTYVPPATTFILGRSGGASYGQQPLKNKHWNALREGVKSGQARFPNGGVDNERANEGNKYTRRNTYKDNTRRNGSRRNNEQNGDINRVQSMEGERPVNNEKLPSVWNSVRRTDEAQKQQQKQRNGYRDTEDQIVMQKDQNYYRAPDYSKVFDEADRNNKTTGKRNSYRNGSSRNGTDSDRQPQQQQTRQQQKQQQQQQRNGHRDTEDQIAMQQSQNYYATPDYSKVFDEADRNNRDAEKRNSTRNGSTTNGTKSDRQPQQQRESTAGLLPWQRASLNNYDDYDWQRKNENAGKTAANDEKERRRRGSSVYDPEGAKRRTEGIDRRQNNAKENGNGPQDSNFYNNRSRTDGSERRKTENRESKRQQNGNNSIRGNMNGDKRRLSNGQRNSTVEHPSQVPVDQENGTENRRDNRDGRNVRKQSYSEEAKRSDNGTRGYEADESDSIDMSKVNGKQKRRGNPEKSPTGDDIGQTEDETGAIISDRQNYSEIASDNEKEESDVEDEEKKLLKKEEKGLFGILKKCAPKFATKLLDAIEKEKAECAFCLDQFSEKYNEHLKQKKQPVFTSYSCENGDTDDNSVRASIKKLRNLVGGFYSKACTEMEAFVETIDDMLEEKKPEEDGKWSAVEGEHGTRYLPQYDNQIEDHTIYVCSCCFNEVVDRDAYVNIKYFGAEYGCCKPKIVSRSFENRPFHCERMLASMSEKRRSCFLKLIGKKHQMKSGVHCVSKIPSMDKEAEGNQNEAAQCSASENET